MSDIITVLECAHWRYYGLEKLIPAEVEALTGWQYLWRVVNPESLPTKGNAWLVKQDDGTLKMLKVNHDSSG